MVAAWFADSTPEERGKHLLRFRLQNPKHVHNEISPDITNGACPSVQLKQRKQTPLLFAPALVTNFLSSVQLCL